jgi:hypothetical protein
MEKKILQEHKRLHGTAEIDAKAKYVKLARSLPTFGVHFFLVKVKTSSLAYIRYQPNSNPFQHNIKVYINYLVLFLCVCM